MKCTLNIIFLIFINCLAVFSYNLFADVTLYDEDTNIESFIRKLKKN